MNKLVCAAAMAAIIGCQHHRPAVSYSTTPTVHKLAPGSRLYVSPANEHYSVELSREAGLEMICELAETSDVEDLWLYREGVWHQIGWNKRESSVSHWLPLVKGARPGDEVYHIHRWNQGVTPDDFDAVYHAAFPSVADLFGIYDEEMQGVRQGVVGYYGTVSFTVNNTSFTALQQVMLSPTYINRLLCRHLKEMAAHEAIAETAKWINEDLEGKLVFTYEPRGSCVSNR